MAATHAEIGTVDTSVKNNRHNLRSHRNGSLALKTVIKRWIIGKGNEYYDPRVWHDNMKLQQYFLYY